MEEHQNLKEVEKGIVRYTKKKEWGQPWMRWLDSITDPMDLKIVKEAWCATVTKRWTQLSD